MICSRIQTEHNMSRRSDMHGFTLIELMIIVALLGIFAAIAVPNFTQFINNNRTQSANDEVLALLQYARSTAVSQRTTISVCPDDDAWSVKVNGCDSTDTLRSMDVIGGTSINSSQDEITFRHNGSSGTPATILTCRQEDFANGYTIKVASAGSIRTYARGKSGTGENDVMDDCEQ